MSDVKSPAITNRYDFMLFFDCENGNPNGDPDSGNAPRIDPETQIGWVTDVSIKRRVRNYVSLARGNESPFRIYIEESTNLNTKLVEAYQEIGMEPASVEDSDGEQIEKKAPKSSKSKSQSVKDVVYSARGRMCSEFYDVRTFGAVMSTGPNAGQVNGPVQIGMAKSLDPIVPSNLSITRVACAETGKLSTLADYQNYEKTTPENKMRTMGRKHVIPYGLYVVKGHVSASLAQKFSFTEEDISLLWESLLNMYEHCRTSSKGFMSSRKLVVFKHVGTSATDNNPSYKANQCRLGCAPAHRLLDLNTDVSPVSYVRSVECPRLYADYTITLDRSKVPDGVEMIEMI